MNRRTEKGWPYMLRSSLATLPPGRHRVAWALLADPFGATYREVALRLGLNLGTVYEHVRRIRLLHPEVYAVLMAERSCQLARRHKRALARARAHSDRWLTSRLPIAGIRPNSNCWCHHREVVRTSLQASAPARIDPLVLV